VLQVLVKSFPEQVKSKAQCWNRDDGFDAEFERQRSEIVEAAFGMVVQNIEKAVSTLMGSLYTADVRRRNQLCCIIVLVSGGQSGDGSPGTHTR